MDNTALRNGQGKKCIRFVAETLKPFADRNFRTNLERAQTGTGGNIMSGLVSIYSGIMYCEVFGKFGSNVLGVFCG